MKRRLNWKGILGFSALGIFALTIVNWAVTARVDDNFDQAIAEATLLHYGWSSGQLQAAFHPVLCPNGSKYGEDLWGFYDCLTPDAVATARMHLVGQLQWSGVHLQLRPDRKAPNWRQKEPHDLLVAASLLSPGEPPPQPREVGDCIRHRERYCASHPGYVCS